MESFGRCGTILSRPTVTNALVRRDNKLVWRHGISWLFSPHIWTAIASSDQGLADSRLFPDLPTVEEHLQNGIRFAHSDEIVSSIRDTLSNHEIPPEFAGDQGFEKHRSMGILCFKGGLQDWLMERLPSHLMDALNKYVQQRCQREREEEEVRAAASPAAGPGLPQGPAASPAAGRGGGAPDDASPAAPISTAAGGDPTTPSLTQLHLRGGAFLSPPPRRS